MIARHRSNFVVVNVSCGAAQAEAVTEGIWPAAAGAVASFAEAPAASFVFSATQPSS